MFSFMQVFKGAEAPQSGNEGALDKAVLEHEVIEIHQANNHISSLPFPTVEEANFTGIQSKLKS